MTNHPESGQEQIAIPALHANLPASPEPMVSVSTPDTAAPERNYSQFELWLHRITVLMFVFVCAAVGVLLVILPWRPEWTDNYLLQGSPWLQAFMGSGFVRGVCSGLGILDIWIGFWKALHYHEIQR